MSNASVVRLANSPKGQPYRIDRHDKVPEATAAELASRWWDSGGTLAVVVTVDGKEDARYEKSHIDPERIPKGWVTRKVKRPTVNDVMERMAAAPAEPSSRVHPEAAPPDLGEEDVEPSVAKGMCRTCGLPVPQEPFPGDSSPNSPSSRIAGHRCPMCGRPLTGAHMGRVNIRYLKVTGRRR